MIQQSKREKVGKAFLVLVILFLIAGIFGCQKIDKSNDLEDQQKDNSAKVGYEKSNNPVLDFKLELYRRQRNKTFGQKM